MQTPTQLLHTADELLKAADKIIYDLTHTHTDTDRASATIRAQQWRNDRLHRWVAPYNESTHPVPACERKE